MCVIKNHIVTEKEIIVCVAGKNDIAVEILKYLSDYYKNEIDIVVVCNKEEVGCDTWQKSLRLEAKRRNIRVCKLEELYEYKHLVFLSLEFDQIIRPEKFLTDALYNIHFSLLPCYRGMYTSALPILNGEKYSGVTLHRIDRGIDTGDIIAQKIIELDEGETARSLYIKYINMGITLMKENVYRIIFKPHELHAEKQDIIHASYYGRKAINYGNLLIDMNQTAISINRQIRAYSFREYQMPEIYGKKVIGSKITKRKSQYKPGKILVESELGFIVSTLDNDLIIYYDRFDELIQACIDGDFELVKEICTVKQHLRERNTEGKTALIIANDNGHREIVNYLLCCDEYATLL